MPPAQESVPSMQKVGKLWSGIHLEEQGCSEGYGEETIKRTTGMFDRGGLDSRPSKKFLFFNPV